MCEVFSLRMPGSPRLHRPVVETPGDGKVFSEARGALTPLAFAPRCPRVRTRDLSPTEE